MLTTLFKDAQLATLKGFHNQKLGTVHAYNLEYFVGFIFNLHVLILTKVRNAPGWSFVFDVGFG